MTDLLGSRYATTLILLTVHSEVTDYDKGYGFSVRHDRGKNPIAEVVEW